MTAAPEPTAGEPVCGAGVIWPREGGTVHTCALAPHRDGMHYDGRSLHWFEARAAAPCAQCETLRAENQHLDATLEEERRLIDGERRAHEARAGAAAWFLEGARQSDGTYRPEPVCEAIRQLRAALDPQQFTKWPEDWAAHRAERDAARGAT